MTAQLKQALQPALEAGSDQTEIGLTIGAAVAESRQPFAFRAAIARAGVNVIAEIKSASPSAGSIVDDPDVEAIARDYARGGAAAMSVVTEPEFFRGSRDWIARAKSSPPSTPPSRSTNERSIFRMSIGKRCR